jgi:hypothetical protein
MTQFKYGLKKIEKKIKFYKVLAYNILIQCSSLINAKKGYLCKTIVFFFPQSFSI